MNVNFSKVIIVGGGIAGLLAARHFEREKIPYLLLEAKAQLGGRIFSPTGMEHKHSLDLGPTWLFPHQPKIRALAKTLKLQVVSQYSQGDVLFEKSNGDVSQLSGAPVPPSYRIAGGMMEVIAALLSQLDSDKVKTSHPVTKVQREEGQWCLDVNGQIFQCEQLFLALPPRMISQHLTPQHWASPQLQRQLQGVATWMAAQAKFMVTYSEAFWRDRGLSGQVFSQRGPMVEMHDACDDVSDCAALFGFIGISALQRQQYTNAQVEEACIEQLVRLYGEQAREYQHCYLQDWAQDVWLTSELDVTEPPAHPHLDLQPFVEELTKLTLKLIGSECARNEAGYLEGAIHSVESALAGALAHD